MIAVMTARSSLWPFHKVGRQNHKIFLQTRDLAYQAELAGTFPRPIHETNSREWLEVRMTRTRSPRQEGFETCAWRCFDPRPNSASRVHTLAWDSKACAR